MVGDNYSNVGLGGKRTIHGPQVKIVSVGGAQEESRLKGPSWKKGKENLVGATTAL